MSFIIKRMSNMSIIPQHLKNKNQSQLSLNMPYSNSKKQLFDLKTVQILNAKISSFYQKKLIILDTSITLVSIIVLVMTILKNFRFNQEGLSTYQKQTDNNFLNLNLNQNLNENQNQKSFFLLQESIFAQQQKLENKIFLLFSLLAVTLSILKNVCLLQLKQQIQRQQNSKQSSHESLSLFKSKNAKIFFYIILQSLFYLIHPSHYTSDIVIQFMNQPPLLLNKILSCIVYARLVIILLFCLRISRFYGLRVNRVLELYVGDQNDQGILYTIKCSLKQNGIKSPFLIYACIFSIVPLFMIALQQKYILPENQFSGADSYLQAIYDILISMATIGYGDLSHPYLIQRSIIIFILIVGSITSSFLTLTFLNWFELSQQQQKALRSIKSLSIKHKIRQLNTKKVHGFVNSLIQFQKRKKIQQTPDHYQPDLYGSLTKNKNKKPSHHKKQLSKDLKDIIKNNNQNLYNIQDQFLKKKQFKSILTVPKTPEIKYLKQKLNHQKLCFKDFYQKNQLELSQSIKLLIQKVLLTNNLLEFFLMRLKSNKQHNFFTDPLSPILSDSSESSKSKERKYQRVEDSKNLYLTKLHILNGTFPQKQEPNQHINQTNQQITHRAMSNKQVNPLKPYPNKFKIQ